MNPVNIFVGGILIFLGFAVAQGGNRPDPKRGLTKPENERKSEPVVNANSVPSQEQDETPNE